MDWLRPRFDPDHPWLTRMKQEPAPNTRNPTGFRSDASLPVGAVPIEIPPRCGGERPEHSAGRALRSYREFRNGHGWSNLGAVAREKDVVKPGNRRFHLVQRRQEIRSHIPGQKESLLGICFWREGR